MKAFLLTESFLNKILHGVYESLYPNKCLFCRKVLEDKDAFACCIERSEDCGINVENIDKIYVPYKYEGLVSDCIFRFKYNGFKALAKPMANGIFAGLEENDGFGDFLVPVPLHPERLKMRGYNQSALLAVRLGTLLGLPVYDGLKRIKNTKRQAELRPEERIENLAGAMEVKDGFGLCVKDKHVVLVDDILTTGSTAAECGRVLRKAGAKRVDLVVFAGVVFGG